MFCFLRLFFMERFHYQFAFKKISIGTLKNILNSILNFDQILQFLVLNLFNENLFFNIIFSSLRFQRIFYYTTLEYILKNFIEVNYNHQDVFENLNCMRLLYVSLADIYYI